MYIKREKFFVGFPMQQTVIPKKNKLGKKIRIHWNLHCFISFLSYYWEEYPVIGYATAFGVL
ncbi:MAG: hypothetical protein AMDU4_FER2C00091G0001 [Ferroplasma sp. Type II]|jgi:hypothetical protein|nr:MAG: hypothetical protein AMDU4_FER2C00091G0001 [Ferroplasma sp. Type II]